MNYINNKNLAHITPSIDFTLPKNLECSKPTEERGIDRDEVRLLVSHYQNDQMTHTQFKSIGQFLLPGDVLVVNTSGTLAAAIPATYQTKKNLRVHLSTQRSEKVWVVEVREVLDSGTTKRYNKIQDGHFLDLKGGGRLELVQPYYTEISKKAHLQLWVAKFQIAGNVIDYLNKNGQAIRYGYVETNYPLDYYQTVFSKDFGSAEMPSAGRAFTNRLVTELVARGIVFAPILLHTGVASLESDERPYEEYFKVPNTTARLVNLARAEGRRVIAVGTTAIRALETVTNPFGETSEGEGWTNVFITPERGLYGIDGLITGFHEPKASHLLMMEALSGKNHLKKSYAAALEEEYQWHEFGDLHLLLP